ncbi:MAG: HAD-IIIA family hydrolase [Candidatus Fermentibacteraceae bacterium]
MISAEPVFLDRDGVINENRRDYVRSLSQWIPLPGVFKAMARLCSAGHPLIVVTNQSGIARGFFDEAELTKIHDRMNTMMRSAGGSFAGIEYCPHAPWDGCACRKPETGLIDRALMRLSLPERSGWIVGDAETDMELGRRTGLRTVLVLTGRGGAQLDQIIRDGSPRPDFVSEDLGSAADLILGYESE